MSDNRSDPENEYHKFKNAGTPHKHTVYTAPGIFFIQTCAFLQASYKCQISSLYCAIVRSDEKNPALLILTSIFFAHAMRSS